VPNLAQTFAQSQSTELSQKRSLRLRQITEKIIGLPTLPTVVTQLIAVVGDPSSSARQIARLVSTDQALTAKILKVANSSFYGFAREISTVQLAIVVLGIEMVKNIGLSVAVLKRFSEGKEHRLFDRQRFWAHAIGCGVASRMLAIKFKDRRIADEAFVAGVLHDIGKLILIEYFYDEFVEALEKAEAEGLSIVDAEEQVLGVSHADVGAWLAEKWNLPTALVRAIGYHHRPFEPNPDKPEDLVLLTHLGDALIRHLRVGNSGDQQLASLDSRVAGMFKKGRRISDDVLFEELGIGLEAELETAQVFEDLKDDTEN
jgi:putative nucleotidyltransferase with HDIG domain